MRRDGTTDVNQLFDARDTAVTDVDEENTWSSTRRPRMALGTAKPVTRPVTFGADFDDPTSQTVVHEDLQETSPPTSPVLPRSAARGKRTKQADFDEDFPEAHTLVDDSASPAEQIARALADRRADETDIVTANPARGPLPDWSDPADLDGPIDWDEDSVITRSISADELKTPPLVKTRMSEATQEQTATAPTTERVATETTLEQTASMLAAPEVTDQQLRELESRSWVPMFLLAAVASVGLGLVVGTLLI
jgi:hypothetical protein